MISEFKNRFIALNKCLISERKLKEKISHACDYEI